MKLFAPLLLLCCMALAACTTEAPLAPTSASQLVETSYRLGTGDQLRLNVFNEPTLSGSQYSVNSDGDVSLPLIGAVQVGGLTLREAEAAITAKYANGYLQNPRVNIDIINQRPFYILGEVNKPGEYAYVDGLTVLNAVAKAEGYTYRANRTFVYIRRSGSNSEERVDLTAATPVLPGDTVRIVERYF